MASFIFAEKHCKKEVSCLTDADYMREALRVAAHARGRTSPNPLVGAVIVKDGRIVGEGWHRKAGTPHAEVHALAMAGELARGATLYVTLEPCAHYGRTGPCAKAVAEAGVKRAVIAMSDPNPLVAGKGIEMLRQAGVEVEVGLMAREAARLNEVFLLWIERQRPFVLLKAAMSLDGKIATAAGDSQWISGEKSRARVHLWRDEYDGIMAGIGTVLADNPSLTARLPDGTGRNPVRIIVDSQARTPPKAKVVQDGLARTIIAVTERAPAERVSALSEAGAEVLRAGRGPQVDLALLMQELARQEITSVLVEGGGTLNYSLLEAGLVDKVAMFVAPKLLGGHSAKTPVEGTGFQRLSEAAELTELTAESLEGDMLLTGYVKNAKMPLWLRLPGEQAGK